MFCGNGDGNPPSLELHRAGSTASSLRSYWRLEAGDWELIGSGFSAEHTYDGFNRLIKTDATVGQTTTNYEHVSAGKKHLGNIDVTNQQQPVNGKVWRWGIGSSERWLPKDEVLEAPQRYSASGVQYYQLNDEKNEQRKSYRVSAVTAGDYSDDSRLAEWQHVNGSIVPTRAVAAASLSELFSAYNVTLDADRASYASTVYALSLAATDLEYEATRVKSPVIGRDLNPMGRGDGSYYCNGGNVGGSVAIVGAKPVFYGNVVTGFGNGMNNVCSGACGPGGGDRNEEVPDLPPECNGPAICTGCCLPAWEQTPGINPSCCPENCDFEDGTWELACCKEAFDLVQCSFGPMTQCVWDSYGPPIPKGICIAPGMPCYELGVDWLEKCQCSPGPCSKYCGVSYLSPVNTAFGRRQLLTWEHNPPGIFINCTGYQRLQIMAAQTLVERALSLEVRKRVSTDQGVPCCAMPHVGCVLRALRKVKYRCAGLGNWYVCYARFWTEGPDASYHVDDKGLVDICWRQFVSAYKLGETLLHELAHACGVEFDEGALPGTDPRFWLYNAYTTQHCWPDKYLLE